MAGGLFGKPFALNIKCVIFSLIQMGLFLYAPNIQNQYMLYFILFLIFVVSYVALAWYDYYYDCRILPFKRGKLSLTGTFKPPPHMPKLQLEHKETDIGNKRNHHIIHLSHILIIAPLLLYMFIQRDKVNPTIYPLLGALIALTLGYHGIQLMLHFHKD
jgi:hypothetical protein